MKKHNQWMQILSTIFSALAGLLNALKLKAPNEQCPNNDTSENK